MHYRQLGSTGYDVSEIGFGAGERRELSSRRREPVERVEEAMKAIEYPGVETV